MSKALPALAKFYNNYKKIDPKKFEPKKLYDKFVKELVPALELMAKEIPDPSTPTTHFTTLLIFEKHVTEKKFIEVNLNLKEVQKALKTMDFGSWFELADGKRVKVAWYNSKTLRYMLVDQTGKKVALKTELEFAREILSGEAKIMISSTKPFFERALENIFQGLNARQGSLISR